MRKIKSAKLVKGWRYMWPDFGEHVLKLVKVLGYGSEQAIADAMADLETLAAAGLVALTYEDETPKWRTGDWIVLKTGQANPHWGNAYRFKAQRDYDASIAGDDDCVLAPPEPPAAELAKHKPLKVVDFRPPKNGEWFADKDSRKPVYWAGSEWDMGPRYILAPIASEKPAGDVEWYAVYVWATTGALTVNVPCCSMCPAQNATGLPDFKGYRFHNDGERGALWAFEDTNGRLYDHRPIVEGEPVAGRWVHASHVGFRKN